MKIKNNKKHIISNAVSLRRECGIYLSHIYPSIWKNNFLTSVNLKVNTKDWPLIYNKKSENLGNSLSPYQLAMKYLKSVNAITALEVNNVLAFSGISITQNLLDNILNRPRLVFQNLSLCTLNSSEFLEQVGTIRKEKCPAGVYIWTHLSTGDKYVGSSSSLARRLIGYFKNSHADVGKLIPLIKSEGVGAFNLEVIPLITDYKAKQELSIEQYFLLHSEYNLNRLRVVNNISGSRSKSLFMYTKDFTKLMFSSSTQEDFIFKFRIHHTIFTQSIMTGSIYLGKGKYIFTDQPVEGAEESNLSESELLAILEEDRLIVKQDEENRVGRKVTIRSIKDGNFVQIFDSISDCIAFLNSTTHLLDSEKGSTAGKFSKTTLYRYIKSGKPYNGFICQWTDDQTSHIKDKSIGVKVLHIPTGTVNEYLTIRKAALAFDPVTTGQTIKAYIPFGLAETWVAP
uniref:GIY-YIG domain-containing protein n=1 Tax=Chrysoporthe austroafricana TaxID=354353 RepID=A0A191MX02_9PEZI|nr:hypothetical protein [Chrysoporthe austroafricana]AMX22134.1 hypothetical protein [Chrysoporthe austroafricana]